MNLITTYLGGGVYLQTADQAEFQVNLYYDVTAINVFLVYFPTEFEIQMYSNSNVSLTQLKYIRVVLLSVEK